MATFSQHKTPLGSRTSSTVGLASGLQLAAFLSWFGQLAKPAFERAWIACAKMSEVQISNGVTCMKSNFQIGVRTKYSVQNSKLAAGCSIKQHLCRRFVTSTRRSCQDNASAAWACNMRADAGKRFFECFVQEL